MSWLSDFLFGSSGKYKNVSTLRQEQEDLYNQLIGAGKGAGAGGAFGTAADYYRNLLSNNPADLAAFSAPMMRQYNEEIVPGLSEQFAGMGSGGLSSSGFRNAQVQGATDLSERLGALRAQLRQQGAQGLAGIGQMGLQNYGQTVQTQPGSQGILSQLGGSIISGIGAPIGGALGNKAINWANNAFGQSSPYGNNAQPGAGVQYR